MENTSTQVKKIYNQKLNEIPKEHKYGMALTKHPQVILHNSVLLCLT